MKKTISKPQGDKHGFMEFAKKRRFIYFDAAVDSSKRDLRAVKGFTLGLSSHDANYMVGSHDDYDIMCVQRQSNSGAKHVWTVMAFELHTAVYLPHILLGKKSQVEPLYNSLPGMKEGLEVHEFTKSEHRGAFSVHFIAYAPPAYNSTIEHVISPELTNAVVDHIQHVVIEVIEDTVYLATDHLAVSAVYLDKIMHYGIQFARHIDEKMGAA